ncbi:helix-turn-helix domain-containing protein (plasmid) [Embleya sp. NBC_00888]|uniref:helix-turn-helix domain-containing protein n=1 Tax=Embleya sp. NBC_00888 TaxID=2975960 RepID=UPI002F90B358|nr:helix-turn-helix domain-containing protein [Embleya sp. NBC_00888]
MRRDAFEPINLPDEVWQRPHVTAALRDRRIGHLFSFVLDAANGFGISQTRIANLTLMEQSEVSRIKQGNRTVAAIDVLERIALAFGMPNSARNALGLASLPENEKELPTASPSPIVVPFPEPTRLPSTVLDELLNVALPGSRVRQGTIRPSRPPSFTFGSRTISTAGTRCDPPSWHNYAMPKDSFRIAEMPI